ncbi:HAD-IC family P-type ATPase [Scytonema sp. UIC 10036]|uniref:cation-translocating P-type ATPase n=1 Tax=Scytonema sp. UIC 10036 TaxID=2304196 RepID=UPI0012DA1DD8|nr:cation-translocating P-type ATPase [Scytonema sp. UIC 10036]MUG93640.1 HAD-IC family P-type ATPase [Scytonema sp. UIC 10036]
MIHQFNSNPMNGLSESEAAIKLKREGYNELPSSKRRSFWGIAREIIEDPIFLLLVACGAIYTALGDMQEALILLGFVFFIMGISLYQETKTERALEALQDLSSPRALVIRDGQKKRIAGREVVRGDVVFLAEGDRVPADAVLLDCTHLLVDESLLTGESLPVQKIAVEVRANDEFTRPGGDNLPFVYSGTLVVQGQGIAKVQATGSHTQIGKIGKALQGLKLEQTALQKEMARLVKNLAIAALAICAVVVVVYGLTRGNWLQGSLAGITLAMAILPNEFPVVVTIFLALGAWRIAQKQVLTRRIPAVETLGSTTVLCVDKTGTLTLNQMSVQQLCSWNQNSVHQNIYDLNLHAQEPLPEKVHQLVEFSILASHKDPFDPMEKAFKQLGNRYLAQTEHIHHDWTLLKEYPLSPQMLAMSQVWQTADGENCIIAAKGSPEAVADLCHFTSEQMHALAIQINQMANDGLRVLGVAKASLKDPPPAFFPPHPAFSADCLPDVQHDFAFEFVGLVGLADPIRPTVAQAIQECYTAGVRVVMITGDYPGTAQNIAQQVGLLQMGEIVTGSELDEMDDSELQQRISSVNIFARVVPEQKLRIVNALKANGEIVAMTGDGVNDAPALKSAHIGIAMGGRGTDVARESADLVLLEDDFSTIVQAVKLGRRIFDNLRKAMAYLLAIHVPIAGMSLIPVLLKLPLVMLPVHVAFLHLIIDPACSIVLEAEPAEPNVMNRSPRNPTEPVFGRQNLGLALLQGVGILTIILLIYLISLYRGQGELDARALTFTALLLANLGLIASERSSNRVNLTTFKSPNPAFWWVIGGGLVFLWMVLYVPFLRHLFRFSYLHPIDLAICLVAGVMSFFWFELLKIPSRKRRLAVTNHSHSEV